MCHWIILCCFISVVLILCLFFPPSCGSDGYVTSDSGTGIVHQAPGFGEDDFRVCQNYGIIKKGERVVCPVDSSGRFTSEVTDFRGQYVKVRRSHCILYSIINSTSHFDNNIKV